MTRQQLTRCESEVMDIVWRSQPVTIHDVVDAIDRDLAYTTVMTTMRILEDKGVVRRGEKIGRAYTYCAEISREQVRHSMIRELTDQLFGGSIRSLVLSLIDSEEVSSEDLEAVRKMAEEVERNK